MSDAAAGTIRDRGYQRYEGARTPGRGVIGAIMRRMLRSTVRQPWVLVMLIFSSFPVLIWAVYVVMRSYFTSALSGVAEGAEQAASSFLSPNASLLNLGIKPYGVLLIAFLMAMFAGAGAIADDRRLGTLPFYLSRPLDRVQYLAGKVLTVVTLVAFTTVGPLVLLSLVQVAVAKDRGDVLRSVALVPASALFGAIEAVLFALPAVVVSSLVRSRGFAQALYAAIVLLPWMLRGWLTSTLRASWPGVIAIPSQIESVGHFLLRVPTDEMARVLPAWMALGAVIAVCVGSGYLLMRQMKRFESGVS
jgi:ABC-2 type transport system permease protein